MKIVRILFFLALACGVAQAQGVGNTRQPVINTPPEVLCTLSIEQSPAMLGLRLGMSTAQVQGSYPNLRIPPPDEFGVAPVYLKGEAVRAELGGVIGSEEIRDLALEFTDGRLTFIRIGYPLTNKWRSSDQFVASVAEQLKLSGHWDHFYDLDDKTFRGMEDFRDLFIECRGFRISAGIGTEGIGEQTPHIKIEDMVASQTVRKRQNEKARREAESQKEKP